MKPAPASALPPAPGSSSETRTPSVPGVASNAAILSAPAAASHPHCSFLAFDYGTRRVGVAAGNSLTRAARPLRTVAAEGDARFAAIGALIAEWQPDALVVGVPFHPDGAPHDNTRRAQRFARQLNGRFHLPVHEVDERYTTTEAHMQGAADVDAASAAIILEQFLNALPAADALREPGSPCDTLPKPVHAGAVHDD